MTKAWVITDFSVLQIIFTHLKEGTSCIKGTSIGCSFYSNNSIFNGDTIAFFAITLVFNLFKLNTFLRFLTTGCDFQTTIFKVSLVELSFLVKSRIPNGNDSFRSNRSFTFSAVPLLNCWSNCRFGSNTFISMQTFNDNFKFFCEGMVIIGLLDHHFNMLFCQRCVDFII